MGYTELDHLNDKEPEAKKAYQRLIEKLQAFGPLKIEPKKQAFI